MDNQQPKNTGIWITIGVIIIIVAAYWLFFRGDIAVNSPIETGNKATTTASSTEAAIIVNNQFDTAVVIIDRITSPKPVWVAIHEDNAGKPGNILGASWVPAGEHLNVKVELVRQAVEGKTYHAMLHQDDGNAGAGFDPKTDSPLTDTTGKLIMKSYQIIFDKG